MFEELKRSNEVRINFWTRFLMPVRYPGGDVKLVLGYTKVSERRALGWRYSEYRWYLKPGEWIRLSGDIV